MVSGWNGGLYFGMRGFISALELRGTGHTRLLKTKPPTISTVYRNILVIEFHVIGQKQLGSPGIFTCFSNTDLETISESTFSVN